MRAAFRLGVGGGRLSRTSFDPPRHLGRCGDQRSLFFHPYTRILGKQANGKMIALIIYMAQNCQDQQANAWELNSTQKMHSYVLQNPKVLTGYGFERLKPFYPSL